MPSSTASRSFANGTSGAQQAMPKPATRNDRRVASRVVGRSADSMCMGTPRRLRVREKSQVMRASGKTVKTHGSFGLSGFAHSANDLAARVSLLS
jgi:hypothetical protein